METNAESNQQGGPQPSRTAYRGFIPWELLFHRPIEVKPIEQVIGRCQRSGRRNTTVQFIQQDDEMRVENADD